MDNDPRHGGVENRMFFGIRGIRAGIFQGKISQRTLKQWIKYADFPAPFLPKGAQGARVTTWGLVEAWLLLLSQNDQRNRKQHTNPLDHLELPSILVAELHRGMGINETTKSVEKAARVRVERKIEQHIKMYKEALRGEIFDKPHTPKANRALARASRTGTKRRPQRT